MNPTLSFLQKNGLKVSLPLLLLATACGEGSVSSFQPDAGSATAQAIQTEATPTTNGLGVPSASSKGLGTPNVTPPANTGGTSGSVLPPSGSNGSNGSNGGTPTGITLAKITLGGGSPSTSVPEPAALAGLAIAAAGMVVIKRKQSA